MSADEAKEPAPAGEVWAPSLEDLIGPRPDGVTLTTGFVSVPGDMQVKWWRVDPPPSVTEEGVAVSRPPVIALHGGPAFTHHCEWSVGAPRSPPFSRHTPASLAMHSQHWLHYVTGIARSHSLAHSSLSVNSPRCHSPPSFFPLPPSLSHVPRIPSVSRFLPLESLHAPSFSSTYAPKDMQPLELLAYSTAGYPVIFYDQCGCGSSTRVEDPATTAPWLLTIPYYVEELALLAKALGLDSDGKGDGEGEGEGGGSGYYVYGSSWGSVLAQEVAVTRPVGLRGMVLDGALAHGQVRRREERRG